MKMTQQTRSGHQLAYLKDGMLGSTPTAHRAPRYRLDPDLVASTIRERHMNRKKNRPLTAPQKRGGGGKEAPFITTEDMDNGVTPIPDLYDSWKVPFTKQPRLLSSGGGQRPKTSTGRRRSSNAKNSSFTNTESTAGSAHQRPNTATGMRRRRQDTRRQQVEQQQQQQQQQQQGAGQRGGGGGGQRPSTAPGGRAPASLAPLTNLAHVSDAEETAATDAPSAAAATTTTTLPSAGVVREQSSLELSIPTQHDVMLAEQLRLLQLEEETTRRITSEKQMQDKELQHQRKGNDHQKLQQSGNEEEAPYCVHKRVRGWKLTSPAKLWGPGPSRNWQSKKQLQLVKADAENSTVLDAPTSYESSSNGGSSSSSSSRLEHGAAPRPAPVGSGVRGTSRQQRERREMDILKTKARLESAKSRGICQQFRSGHSWDVGHPEIPPPSTYERRALSSSAAAVQDMIGGSGEKEEEFYYDDNEREDIAYELEDVENRHAMYYKDDSERREEEMMGEEREEREEDALKYAADEPFLRQLLSRRK